MKQLKTKQTIAVIGATGKMGTALTRQLSLAGHRVLLFSRDEKNAKKVIRQIKSVLPGADLGLSGCPHDASWEADIIIPAVPYNSEKEVACLIREVAVQKIVVSISNPFNKQYNGLVTSPDTSAAEELQQLLPHSKVVKAFNTVFASALLKADQRKEMPSSFIAGNDPEAVTVVAKLVADTGFQPILTGPLHMSRVLEQMALLLVQLTQSDPDKGMAAYKILQIQNQ